MRFAQASALDLARFDELQGVGVGHVKKRGNFLCFQQVVGIIINLWIMFNHCILFTINKG